MTFNSWGGSYSVVCHWHSILKCRNFQLYSSKDGPVKSKREKDKHGRETHIFAVCQWCKHFEQKRWSKFTDSNTYAVDWESWTLSNCIDEGFPGLILSPGAFGGSFSKAQNVDIATSIQSFRLTERDEYSLWLVDLTIRGWWTRVNRHVSYVNTVAMLQISRGLARTCHDTAGFEEDGQSHYQCIWCSSWCWKGSQILGSNEARRVEKCSLPWKMGHPSPCFPYSHHYLVLFFPCHGDGGSTRSTKSCKHTTHGTNGKPLLRNVGAQSHMKFNYTVVMCVEDV